MDTKYAEDLLVRRRKVHEEQKALLDEIAARGDLPSAEERQTLARMDADFDALTEAVDAWTGNAKRAAELDTAREIIDGLARPAAAAPAARQTSAVEQFLRGAVDPTGNPTPSAFEFDLKPTINMVQRIRGGMDAKEARAIYTDGGASAGSIVVPSAWSLQLYQYIEAESAILQLGNVFTTESGNPLNFEKVTTHGVGTQVIAQGTAIGGTDPVFGTITLNSYKYGQLVKVSNEAARDVGFDLLGFVAQNIGRAVGRLVDTAYVSGNGSSAPNGIITAASVGATTGGSLIALGGGVATAATGNLDPLIRLQHSVVGGYRNSNKAAFVMNDLTAGTIRQLKDGGSGTVGNYVWVPQTTLDPVTGNRMPDRLFGSPVYTDVNFGTNGSAVKPVAFGDWDAYLIRQIGNFRLESSYERYFDTDEIGFRGVMFTDADLIDTGAIKVLQQAV